MKLLISLLFSICMYSQKYTVVQINAYWNGKNKIELHNGEYDISRIELPVEDYEEPNVDNIIKVIPMLLPSYRNTFELYYLRGYSHKEIAKMYFYN